MAKKIATRWPQSGLKQPVLGHYQWSFESRVSAIPPLGRVREYILAASRGRAVTHPLKHQTPGRRLRGLGALLHAVRCHYTVTGLPRPRARAIGRRLTL